MGIRPTNDPYGGVNPLIDKMIGNAYDIVKYVAANLKTIRYVAENMETVFQAAQNMQQGGGGLGLNTVVLENTANGSPHLMIPSEPIIGEIYGVVVHAKQSDSDWVPASPETFSYVVRPSGSIEIQISHWAYETARFRAILFTG